MLDQPEAAIKLVVGVTDDLVQERHTPQARVLHVQQQPNDEVSGDGVLRLLGCVISVNEPLLRDHTFQHRPVMEVQQECRGLHIGTVLEIFAHGPDQHFR